MPYSRSLVQEVDRWLDRKSPDENPPRCNRHLGIRTVSGTSRTPCELWPLVSEFRLWSDQQQIMARRTVLNGSLAPRRSFLLKRESLISEWFSEVVITETCIHGCGWFGDDPLLRRSGQALKSPSGATPEGQSRLNDQAPRGVLVTTDTTTKATAEAKSRA
jgi:hypothetical protein